jgi:hypothetical protein
MNYTELLQEWQDAAKNNTLLTPKHDPANLSTTYSNFRSVLAPDLATGLSNFFNSDAYKVNRYSDAQRPNGPGYFEIIPASGSPFSIPGSGVQGHSPTPSQPFDRLVIVSGLVQGWHIFAHTASGIAGDVGNGRLMLIDNYTHDSQL